MMLVAYLAGVITASLALSIFEFIYARLLLAAALADYAWGSWFDRLLERFPEDDPEDQAE